jgi:glyoxylase-like metal-dependent hydrolase (beta-lactamase superfamily II)
VEPVVFEVARGITAIDTFYGGRERSTAAYLLDADEPAIVETGPSTSFEPVVAGLERLGIGAADLAHVAVTHIHLDHAGGVGRIAERFPNATVWVHERGARHLADPTRLVASVTSIYGPETTATLFGPVEPVAAQRIRALGDGDRIELGGRHLEALTTPGHAKHHVALADSSTGAVFTGDALGIHPPDARSLRPATPPPDYDLELAVGSIERIRERARGAIVLFSHFGPVHEVERICDLATERFRTWTRAVGEALARGLEPDRDDALEEVMHVLRDVARTDTPTGAEAELDLQAMETMSSIRLNSMGILGYWRRKREAEGSDQAS